MNKKLYKLMNWADIEEIIYSECDHPQDLLGPHACTGGTLIQAYFPGAKAVSVKWLSADPLVGDQCTQMEVADEDGYFAVILPEKKIFNYTYSVTYETVTGKKTIKKSTFEKGDPYRHSQILSEQDIADFSEGKMKDCYAKLGAHVMKHSGELGVHFAVWAPNALRVSVIGEFNNWDGRVNQMKRIQGGFFELFVPGNIAGMKFQYEIKLKGDIILKKNDPYSTTVIDGASVVEKPSTYKWNDSSYIKSRNTKPSKVLIYEVIDGAFSGDSKKFKKEAEVLVKTVKMQGFTHIQLDPAAYQENNTSSYLFAVSDIFSADNLKMLSDICHSAGIGMILNWNISGFGRAASAMEEYDGTALYEHQNPLQGFSADGTMKLFQYARPEVISFLMSNGYYWIKEFHADGICVSSVAKMLYLDYGKSEGNWVPNIYGGNENLEAIEFLKAFISSVNADVKGFIFAAEDSSTHGGMTVLQAEGGMGFDYKWNEGFAGEFFRYMSYDPIERSSQHYRLLDELVYAYAEKFILPVSKKIAGYTENIADMFPGSDEMKANSTKLALAYQYMHPGYKLVSSDVNAKQAKLIAELNKLFAHEPAVGDKNDASDSFEWLSNMRNNECFVSFIRKTDDPEEMMIAVANFAGIEQTITTGVPYEGKYIEIINTDSAAFGGSGIVNSDTLCADAKQSDGRAQSITLNLAPLSMAIFKFEPYTESELVKVIEERIRFFTPVKKDKVIKNKNNKK